MSDADDRDGRDDEHGKETGAPVSSATRLPPDAPTYPPSAWVTDSATGQLTAPESEGVRVHRRADSTGGLPPTEREARDYLKGLFATAGVRVQFDYTFRHQGLVVTLDGYDPQRRVGFAYVSHSDVDVVTDMTPAVEMALRQLAAEGVAFVLILHDYDVPSINDLAARANAFLESLGLG